MKNKKEYIKKLEEHKDIIKDFLKDYKLEENEVIENDLLMCSVCGDIKLFVRSNKNVIATACQCRDKRTI